MRKWKEQILRENTNNEWILKHYVEKNIESQSNKYHIFNLFIKKLVLMTSAKQLFYLENTNFLMKGKGHLSDEYALG